MTQSNKSKRLLTWNLKNSLRKFIYLEKLTRHLIPIPSRNLFLLPFLFYYSQGRRTYFFGLYFET